MSHPIQSFIFNKSGTLLYSAVQNKLIVFNTKTWETVFEWEDTVGIDYVIQKKFEKIIEQGDKQEEDLQPQKKKKVPKIPKPGPGSPEIFNDVRNLYLSPEEKYFVLTTNSDKAAVIFAVEGDKLRLLKRQPFPKRPCSIVVAPGEQEMVLGDKFGDVYKIPIDSPVVENLSDPLDSEGTKQQNSLPTPILGHVSMLTAVLVSDNKILTADRDEHIRVSQYPNAYVIDRWLFGHKEFVSEILVPPFNKDLLVSAGGDSFILVWEWQKSDSFVQKLDISQIVAPFLNKEKHGVPERWLKPGKPELEYCVSKMCLTLDKKLVVLVEHTELLIVYKYNETEKRFEYETQAAAPSDITYIGTNNGLPNGVYCSTSDSRLYKYSWVDNTGKFELIEEVTWTGSSDKKYPLYTVNVLRKRSEH